MRASSALHPFEHLLLEGFAAQTPATTQGPERFLVGCLRPASFHPDLKFPPARRRVLTNAVLPQQTVRAKPMGAMLRSRQISTIS
jgi:hypothetical protein